MFARLRADGASRLLLCGVETHVCVQQTALDMMADGWRVYVAVDAVGSRFEIDYQTALCGWTGRGDVDDDGIGVV